MKILCICSIGIGNYLMCYPACRILKKRNPQTQLHLLALRNAIAELADSDPLWDSITVFDPTRIKGIISRLKIIQMLRKKHFDVSLNFFPSNKWEYNLLPFLCGISHRWGFDYYVRKTLSFSFLCTRKIHVNENLHDINQNIALVEAFLGADLAEEKILFPKLFDEQDVLWAKDFFRCSSDGKTGIAIHPGSSTDHGMDSKRWASDKFAALADYICDEFGTKAYIVGGPQEEMLKQQVQEKMRNNAVLVEAVALRKTAALLSLCSLCLCNDSGIMHVAASLGLPVVAIFGPTDERRNGPWGKNNLVVRKKIEGFPLWTARNVGRRKIPKGIDPQASLKALSAAEAWTAVKPWLESIGFRPVS